MRKIFQLLFILFIFLTGCTGKDTDINSLTSAPNNDSNIEVVNEVENKIFNELDAVKDTESLMLYEDLELRKRDIVIYENELRKLTFIGETELVNEEGIHEIVLAFGMEGNLITQYLPLQLRAITDTNEAITFQHKSYYKNNDDKKIILYKSKEPYESGQIVRLDYCFSCSMENENDINKIFLDAVQENIIVAGLNRLDLMPKEYTFPNPVSFNKNDLSVTINKIIYSYDGILDTYTVEGTLLSKRDMNTSELNEKYSNSQIKYGIYMRVGDERLNSQFLGFNDYQVDLFEGVEKEFSFEHEFLGGENDTFLEFNIYGNRIIFNLENEELVNNHRRHLMDESEPYIFEPTIHSIGWDSLIEGIEDFNGNIHYNAEVLGLIIKSYSNKTQAGRTAFVNNSYYKTLAFDIIPTKIDDNKTDEPSITLYIIEDDRQHVTKEYYHFEDKNKEDLKILYELELNNFTELQHIEVDISDIDVFTIAYTSNRTESGNWYPIIISNPYLY